VNKSPSMGELTERMKELFEKATWETQTFPESNSMSVHSLVIGEVLCRWWGDKEPEGAAALANIPLVIEERTRLLKLLKEAHVAMGQVLYRSPITGDWFLEHEPAEAHCDALGAVLSKIDAAMQKELRP
jgi:hypothetical protein